MYLFINLAIYLSLYLFTYIYLIILLFIYLFLFIHPFFFVFIYLWFANDVSSSSTFYNAERHSINIDKCPDFPSNSSIHLLQQSYMFRSKYRIISRLANKTPVKKVSMHTRHKLRLFL